MDVRADAAREVEGHEHDVLDPGLDVGVAAGDDSLRGSLEPIAEDRQVVGPEVPERVDVLPDLAEVQPLRVDVADVAELAGRRCSP